jgi:hypothetical protein
MKRIHWAWLAAAILVVATLACSGGAETATPETPPTAEAPPTMEAPPTTEAPPTMMPTNTPKPAPTTEPEQDASIDIVNDSGMDIWYIYLSPVKSDEWGEDWLGDDVIPAGDTYTVAGIPEGMYDLLAENEDGDEIETLWDAKLEGAMTWTVTGAASFEIFNDTDTTIGYLFISPTDSDDWGEDWLGEDVIDPGDTYVVSDIPRGDYDIKAEDLDQEFIEALYSVDLHGPESWTVVGKTYLPDNAVLRFEDDFEDNRNNWGYDAEDENVFFMRPANGEYCILIKSDNFTAWEWYEPFTTDEFVAEVACTAEGEEYPTCGLGFGPDGDNLYWFEVSASDQTFALFLLEGDEWQDNLIDWTHSYTIDPLRVNYLRLERVRGNISLYINSVLVAEADGTRFPTGRVGIGGSTYDKGNATVCLDNLRVWRLE